MGRPISGIVIVPGSGNEPRQESHLFVDIITQDDIAVYLDDKRGIGGSTGSYPVETIENPLNFLEARAQDVIGILELLTRHRDIDPKKMGMIGSSQGAWVGFPGI